MREARIGGGQRGDHLEQLDQAGAQAAARGRDPQRAELGAAKLGETVEGQLAIGLALRRALADLPGQFRQRGQRGIETGTRGMVCGAFMRGILVRVSSGAPPGLPAARLTV
ncbi:hypothetical protein [Burkholderia gladioli]|uniref:hypothetical protein n=1 Tax=Burkholderia gladioli TaxID=28095 RepID=UPI001FC8D95E|nr:hypothetical protein [Burkholderia gladioli]